jgi:hypothetical protein
MGIVSASPGVDLRAARAVAFALDWTGNHEKDALDEADRPTHQRCPDDGLDGRSPNRFSDQ